MKAIDWSDYHQVIPGNAQSFLEENKLDRASLANYVALSLDGSSASKWIDRRQELQVYVERYMFRDQLHRANKIFWFRMSSSLSHDRGHNLHNDSFWCRLVTSLIRRNVTLKRVSVVREAGTAEFKSLYRSGSTVLPNKAVNF